MLHLHSCKKCALDLILVLRHVFNISFSYHLHGCLNLELCRGMLGSICTTNHRLHCASSRFETPVHVWLAPSLLSSEVGRQYRGEDRLKLNLFYFGLEDLVELTFSAVYGSSVSLYVDCGQTYENSHCICKSCICLSYHSLLWFCRFWSNGGTPSSQSCKSCIARVLLSPICFILFNAAAWSIYFSISMTPFITLPLKSMSMLNSLPRFKNLWQDIIIWSQV
jgi:hypothetical protein